MSDGSWRHRQFPWLEAEEPRIRQQREMAKLWMALNALRPAEAVPTPPAPRRAAPAYAGFVAAGPELEPHMAWSGYGHR
jgi:hypothetical protein